MTNHFDFIEALNDFSSFDESFEQYNYIPAVKHRKLIADICSNLNALGGISLICPAISLDNGNMFYTSNNPELAAAYIKTGLYRADNYFAHALKQDKPYFFPNLASASSNDFLQKMVLTVLEEKFKVYNTYCLVRKCADCTVIIGVTHDYQVKNREEVYKETISDVEQLAVSFFDKMINIYADELPMLKHSRFATDEKFREKTLKERTLVTYDNNQITSRERECLYWISKGKTSAEISTIMNISELTVNQHKKNILSKMSVSNMVQAVRDAIRFKIIV